MKAGAYESSGRVCEAIAMRWPSVSPGPGWSGRFPWKGPLYGDAKTRAFTSADAFLLPSHSENFGIVVAEALAHGVPVLTTKTTPWQTLESENCGWWVSPTTAAIAAGLTEVVKASDETRKAMGARGRAFVKRQFAWSAIARNMRATYESIVEQPPSAGNFY